MPVGLFNGLERKRDGNDELMVDLVDGVHVPVSRVPGYLWLGLSRMGTALPALCPATSRAPGIHDRAASRPSPPVLGMGRRLRLGGFSRCWWLGLRGPLAAMRSRR